MGEESGFAIGTLENNAEAGELLVLVGQQAGVQ